MNSLMVPNRMSRNLPSLFDPFFLDPDWMKPVLRREQPFPIDIKSTDEAYTVIADFPGAKEEDISLDFDNGTLTMSFRGETKKEEEKDGYICRERVSSYGSRSIPIGNNIDQENIDASYEDGTLTIVLPKKEPEGKKGIEIAFKK